MYKLNSQLRHLILFTDNGNCIFYLEKDFSFICASAKDFSAYRPSYWFSSVVPIIANLWVNADAIVLH